MLISFMLPVPFLLFHIAVLCRSNVTLYSNVSISPVVNDDQLIIDLPSTGAEPVQTVLANNNSMNINEGDIVNDKSMIKLSSLSKSQWHCLQYMDAIKVHVHSSFYVHVHVHVLVYVYVLVYVHVLVLGAE